MKKQLRISFLISFMFIMFTCLSYGQTSITIFGAFDSAGTAPCPPPVSAGFFLYGMHSGYASTDTLDIYINFGDGTDSTVRFVTDSNTQGYFQASMNHSYFTSGQYSVQYIVTGPDGNGDTLIQYNQVMVGDTCGNISGVIYIDANSNCIFDTGDTPVPWINVQLIFNSNVVEWSYSDSIGNYYFDVPTGIAYTVQIGNYPSFSAVCPASGNYVIATAPSSGNDFALTCSGGFDLSGYLNGWGFRPGGQQGQVTIGAYNSRCLPVNGQVKLVLDPLVTFVSSNPSPSAISGDTLIWNFSNLASNYFNFWWQNFLSYVAVLTDPGASIGDSVCFTLIVEPVSGDSVPADNIQSRCFLVRNSWDPNDKSVNPEGADPGGRILPDVNSPLTYTIRFQNTGNDTAYNVFIMDTIDSDLDINTFQVLSASHPMDVDIYPGDAVKFSFNNIMLPDSGIDQQGSNGFVVYTIRQKASLANGTVLNNTAGIYFDFNSPVITNTTVNTIDVFLSVNTAHTGKLGFSIYPNPVGTKLTLVFNGEINNLENPRVRMYDVFGRQVMNTLLQLRPDITQYSVPVSGLSAGLYFIRVSSENIEQSLKMIKQE